MSPIQAQLPLHPDAGNFDPSHLSDIYFGGFTLSLARTAALKQRYSDLLIRSGYGMTEMCCGLAHQTHATAPLSVGRNGFLLPGLEARLLGPDEQLTDREVGMLQVKGPTVFKGYWKDPQETVKMLNSEG